MNKKPCIITDVDQVLLDHLGRLREYANKKYNKDIRDLPEKWDLTEWLQLDSIEESIALIREFAEQHEFGTLDAFPGADVVLHSLIRDGYSLITLTACGNTPITVALRKANLFHRFGDIFEEEHFVDLTDSKTDTLRDIASRYDVKAFIDDKPANIVDAVDVGIKNVILMKAPHNRPFREEADINMNLAYSWYECERFINNNN